MKDFSQSHYLSSIEPTKIYRFLKSINQADKILYILEKYGTIRHSEIQRNNEVLPGIVRKSTRTYYKNYKRLQDQGLITRKKEKTKDQQYYAYGITDNGRIYLQKLLKIECEQLNEDKLESKTIIKTERSEKSEKSDRSERSDRSKSTNIEEKSTTINDSYEVAGNLGIILQKLNQNLENLPETIKKAIAQPQNRFSEQMNLYQSNKKQFKETKKTPVPEIQSKRSSLDEKEKLLGLKRDINAGNSEIDKDKVIKVNKKKLENRDKSDILKLKKEKEKEKEKKNQVEYIKTQTNVDLINILIKTPNHKHFEEIIKILGERYNGFENKLKIYDILRKIYGTDDEIKEIKEIKEITNFLMNNLQIDYPFSQYITFISNCTTKQEEENVLELLSPVSKLRLEKKIKLFLALGNKQNQGDYYSNMRKLIDLLELNGKDLIYALEKIGFSTRLSMVTLDIMTFNLIKAHSKGWDELLDFKIQGKPVTRKSFIVDFYIKRILLVKGLYNQIWKIFNLLKQQNQFNAEDREIELLILLNLKEYNLVEKKIKEFQILNNFNENDERDENDESSDESMFIAFRMNYEQLNLIEILKRDSKFGKKWQKIAELEDRLKNKYSIDRDDIHSILLLISKVYRDKFGGNNPPNNIELYRFYTKNFLSEKMLLRFTPHFAKWLNYLGGPNQSNALELLKKLWQTKHDWKELKNYLGFQEEILNYLSQLDYETERIKWEGNLTELRRNLNAIKENTLIN